MAIDIGAGTFNGDTYKHSARTGLDLTNPANASGSLSTFKVWTNGDCTLSYIGTFFGSAGNFSCRDYESLGSITAGSEQTFTGKNCSVQSGDYIGFFGNGHLECNSSGGSGTYYSNAEANYLLDNDSHAYSLYPNSKYALYATSSEESTLFTPKSIMFAIPPL